MPERNGTGPAGAGPMTGRAAGVCVENGWACPAGPGVGWGCGRRMGRGGRGFRNKFFASGQPGWARLGGAVSAGTTDEKQALSEHVVALRAQLDAVQKRLAQLERQ